MSATITFIQIRISHTATEFLDYLNGIEISATLESKNGIDGQVGEELFVLLQNLGAERGASDVEKVLAELSRIFTMIVGTRFQSLASYVRCLTPS